MVLALEVGAVGHRKPHAEADTGRSFDEAAHGTGVASQIFSCAAARAFAASLLELRGGHGVDTLPDHVEHHQKKVCVANHLPIKAGRKGIF